MFRVRSGYLHNITKMAATPQNRKTIRFFFSRTKKLIKKYILQMSLVKVSKYMFSTDIIDFINSDVI